MNEKEFPPAKNWGGNDLVTLYAQMLFDQTIGIMYSKTGDSSATIFTQAQQIIDEEKAITADLKAKGLFFYPNGGSVFMDYKLARDHMFPKDGALSDWQKKNIRANMTSQQALRVCKRLVEKWWK